MITLRSDSLNKPANGSGNRQNGVFQRKLSDSSFYRNALGRADNLCGAYRARLLSFLEKSVLELRHLEKGAGIYEKKLAESGKQREEFSISIADIPLRKLPEAEEMAKLLRGAQAELFEAEARLAGTKRVLELSGVLFARAKEEGWLYLEEGSGKYSQHGDAVRKVRKLADALFHLENIRFLVASGDTEGAQKYYDKHVRGAKTGAAQILQKERELFLAMESDLVLHKAFNPANQAAHKKR